jgi:hypothetical protein
VKKWVHELNGEFSKKEVQMAMKKYATSLIIKEMQIKTTLKFHLTPVRMTRIKGNSSKCWQGWGKTGILMYCW